MDKNLTGWKVMADAYGKLGLYKLIEQSMPGAAVGWEKVAAEDEFKEIHFALKFAEIPTSPSNFAEPYPA